ncbi:MAG: FAD-dependent oxidoreductase [Lentisphaeria bacterium]|nr:FAD-dependent oxidoreductase [Lentisphaeria bacterium]
MQNNIDVEILGNCSLLVFGSSFAALHKACEYAADRKVILAGSFDFPAWDVCGRMEFNIPGIDIFPEIKGLFHGKNKPAPGALKSAFLKIISSRNITFMGRMFPLVRQQDGMLFASCGRIVKVKAEEILYLPLAAASWQIRNIVRCDQNQEETILFRGEKFAVTDSDQKHPAQIISRIYPYGDAQLPESMDQKILLEKEKILTVPPPYGTITENIVLPDFPCLNEYCDLLIIGGGTAGMASAISAGRTGLKVIVVERSLACGGVSTVGRIIEYYHGNRVGFAAELDKACALKSNADPYSRRWCGEARRQTLSEMAANAAVHIIYHAEFAGVIMKDNKCSGALIVSSDGASLIMAENIIDATGNASVAAAAGAKCYLPTEEPALQGSGVPVLTPGSELGNNDFTFTSENDPGSAWRTMQEAAELFAEEFDFGMMLNTRERRRIHARYMVKTTDAFAHRKYFDTITICRSRFDTHGFTTDRLFCLNAPPSDPQMVEIPYRALLPEKVDALLVLGLGAGAERDAMPMLRMQADLLNQGYAAGTVVFLAKKNKVALDNIPITELQKKLEGKAVLPKGFSSRSIDLPTIEAADLPMNLPDIPELVSTVLISPQKFLPEIRQRFAASGSLRYAMLLALLGDKSGINVLKNSIENSDFSMSHDPGWDFTAMGQQTARDISRLDGMVILAACLPGDEIKDVILKKLSTLKPESCFSHFRALSLYFQHHPDKRALQPMTECFEHLLKNPVSALEHEMDTRCRNYRLKCFYLAAALLKCADDHRDAAKFMVECIEKHYGAFADSARWHLFINNKFSDKKKGGN